jgi:hypothetical protein
MYGLGGMSSLGVYGSVGGGSRIRSGTITLRNPRRLGLIKQRSPTVGSPGFRLSAFEYPPAVGRVGYRGCGDGEIRSVD